MLLYNLFYIKWNLIIFFLFQSSYFHLSHKYYMFSRFARDSAVREVGNGKKISDMLTMASNDITNATAKKIKETIENPKAPVNGKK